MQNLDDDKNRRVLVIDDNPDIHDDFRKILAMDAAGQKLKDMEAAFFGEASDEDQQKLRFELETALQGQEGSEKVAAAVSENCPYAVAFVDMRMPPGWDGLTTIEQLWKVDPNLQVVICTAYSDNTWSDICQRLGQTDRLLILKKPFDNVEVRQLSLALTEKWRLAKQASLKQSDLQRLVDERTAQLEEREASLRHKQKLEAVGQLAAGVAHEINTPMQYLGDNLNYLQKGFSRLEPLLENINGLLAAVRETAPETVKEFEERLSKAKLSSLRKQIPEAFKDSVEGVEHVSRIVRAMKEFSHPGVEDQVPVDINHALETTITVAKNEWKYVAEVVTDFSEPLPAVPGYPGELNQVFLNLIVNAAHAINDISDRADSAIGTIRISTSVVDNCVQVEIKDTGDGIPDAIKDRVFDPFFTTKEVGKGTGQGLAIAHSVIVQKHHGQLWFEAKRGVGTVFYIRLPIELVGEGKPAMVIPSDSEKPEEAVI